MDYPVAEEPDPCLVLTVLLPQGMVRTTMWVGLIKTVPRGQACPHLLFLLTLLVRHSIGPHCPDAVLEDVSVLCQVELDEGLAVTV